MKEINLVDIDGINIGHAQNLEGGTGCSVIICKEGATAGVDVRGGAPGTRETDLLNPVNMIEKIHSIVLSGGSAFGLEAANGVMEYLDKCEVGFDVGVTKVPIVCSAVLFDLSVGLKNIRPDKAMGYQAAIHSEHNKEDLQGNVGAGTGATLGKMLGPEHSMKGGLGSYCIQVGDLKIGALIAVNCLGDVVDPKTGEIIAGAIKNSKFINTEQWMIDNYNKDNNVFPGNTTIGAVITNAILTKSSANKIASMAHNGYARTMRPAHTMFDGDTIFTMATNKIEADINVVGMLAARVVEKAVINAVKNANSRYGLIAYKDIV
ncbi:P1 family peptidase [Clostridium sp. MSJ-11]|uniref:P1 family peptidase n=1 Tax=Clostridium mobile TaxID=2841512 RepID=A0ABS6EK69_9CLOT|nr:P1 family peptidase [Clostridium mobile]MBU5484809.1 P1 family peptidase [Clostridium mobile]